MYTGCFLASNRDNRLVNHAESVQTYSGTETATITDSEGEAELAYLDH